MEINYRKLLPKESRLYRAIRLESLKLFPDSFGSVYEEQVQKEKLSFEKNIEDQTEGRFILGAFRNKKLIGICGTYQHANPKTRHRTFIVQMYVKPEFSKQKIGLNLLNAMIEEAFKNPVIEQLELEVFTDNIPANKIYEQANFKEVGILKNYSKSGNQYRDIRLMMYMRPI